MKTTLNIDDTVMSRLKQEAARRKTTMSRLVEAALRAFLSPRRASPGPPEELPAFDGGGTLVDVSNRDRLHDLMEDRG